MRQPSIRLSSVNLHYASTAFKERSLKAWLTNTISPKRKGSEVIDIHALRNVSIQITSGERVGLIGKNGAGKSTLLRAIAGLYPVSSGAIETKGEVRSLFDLSLGFEPDATGRENILFRGLLLGLTPRVMRAMEAEIVEFAGLGEFIDYPIKTYSAGMQVRLAFAISTTVSGDILLLDEVIGAGDASFMARAEVRIRQLVEKAEILILASHDFSALENLCERGLLLHKGEITFDGPIKHAVQEYKNMNGLE